MYVTLFFSINPNLSKEKIFLEGNCQTNIDAQCIYITGHRKEHLRGKKDNVREGQFSHLVLFRDVNNSNFSWSNNRWVV